MTIARDGYSVVLFGPNGRRYRHPPPALVDEIKRMPGVTSVQITFHEDRDAGAPRHAARRLPPRHRQRLRSRSALAARERLKEHFRV